MNQEEEKKMMKKIFNDNFDEMYREDVEEHKDDYEAIKQNFIETHKNSRKSNRIFSKVVFVAAVVCAIFVVSFIMSDIPEIKAFRYDINDKLSSLFANNEGQTHSELNQLAEDEGIVLPSFSYIPEGFEMGNISYKDFGDSYAINYTLTNEDEYISVAIEAFDNEEAQSELFSFHDFERIDKEDKVIALSQNPPYSAVLFYKFYDIKLSSNISREELLKIIEGIQ